MIIGIGIDIVEVSRVKALVRRRTALNRIFTPAEMRYCRRKRYEAESFAARFAAKEAFLKAIGTGWGTAQSPKWTEIEVGNCGLSLGNTRDKLLADCGLNNRQPVIKLYGKAKVINQKLGVKRIHLSLSHTKKHAIAIVILESK
jgi:holo-[acyl-carrier protein] synthase